MAEWEGVEQAHCERHREFEESCAVCRKARANHMPYAVRKTAGEERSFGVKGDVTAETLRAESAAGWSYGSTGIEVGGMSRRMLTMLRKMIWPF